MRHFVVLSLLFSVCVSSVAFSGEELSPYHQAVSPTKSQYFSHKSLNVTRFAVADQTSTTLRNTAQNVVRAFGSQVDKQIVIVWTDKASEKSAKQIKAQLLKRKIPAKNISLTRYKGKRSIYPLFVEVKQHSARKAPCQVKTAEDMMSFDSYTPCATKSNLNIQLKY
ncbi:MAG: protein RcpB [Pasteurellaceae bacterium]|nr:protein RcpB [Pasteurellaceae bacterium]